MTKTTVTRRHAIIAAGGIAATSFSSLLASKIVCARTTRTAKANPLTLIGMIASPRRAYEIGEKYIATTNSVYSFEAILELSPALHDACCVSCENTGQELIYQAIKQEFANNDIVIIDGWVISKIEALICGFWVNLWDQLTTPEKNRFKRANNHA